MAKTPAAHVTPYRLVVEPKGHPGDHDDQEGGDVDGDDVVRDLPLKGHGQLQATVASWEEK